jgi:thiosulfate dehydrogenase [quinone] large subunit
MKHQKSFAVLRIIFGFVWLIDAYFKWQPAFQTNFVSYVTGGLDGQPIWIQTWIHLWISIIGVNPYLFAMLTAIAETGIALSLILGIFTRPFIYLGILFAFVIWTTAESFGGPYKPGSTDIGAAIIYVLVFVSLLLGQSWKSLSLDNKFFKVKKQK